MIPAPQPHPDRAFLQGAHLFAQTKRQAVALVGWPDEAELLAVIAGTPTLRTSYSYEDGRRLLLVRRRPTAA